MNDFHKLAYLILVVENNQREMEKNANVFSGIGRGIGSVGKWFGRRGSDIGTKIRTAANRLAATRAGLPVVGGVTGGGIGAGVGALTGGELEDILAGAGLGAAGGVGTGFLGKALYNKAGELAGMNQRLSSALAGASRRSRQLNKIPESLRRLYGITL